MMTHGCSAYGYGGIPSLFHYPSPNCSFLRVRDAGTLEGMSVEVARPSYEPPGKAMSFVTCAYPRAVNATEVVHWRGPIAEDFYFDAMDDGVNQARVDF